MVLLYITDRLVGQRRITGWDKWGATGHVHPQLCRQEDAQAFAFI